MNKIQNAISFENFSDNDLILAIEQGNVAAKEYALKKYAHELSQILNPLGQRETPATSGATNMLHEPTIPYRSKLLTILIPLASTMLNPTEQSTASSPLVTYFDMSQFTVSDVADILHLLSDIYRSVGGDGLAIKKIDIVGPLSASQS
jgi:hypothetical protein